MHQISGWVICLSVLSVAVPATAQLAPGGFTAAINSPKADVLSPGTASGAWANSNPEKGRDFPGVGSVGSLDLGFGVLPGLEVVGRLAYDGDSRCNMYSLSPRCQASLRDLSASVKYQFPLRFGWDTRLALGAVDIGGAATNFRSYYGVVSSTWGPADFSLGYGKGSHAYSSLNGMFGSAQVFLTERWQALAEYDSHEWRAGLRYNRPLTEQLALEAGASRKLTGRTDQQAWQAGLGLTFSFDKQALNQGTRRLGPAAPSDSSPGTTAAVSTASSEAQGAPRLPVPPTPPAPASATSVPPSVKLSAAEAAIAIARRAEQLASDLQRAGFSSVWVGFDDARAWVVQAEPLLWRKNRLDALGMALAVWRKSAQSDEQLSLVLSYLQQPVLAVRATAACLTKFTEGGWWCDGRPALELDSGQSAHTPTQGWAVAPALTSASDGLRPQFEISPVLRQHMGNEVGLYDASVGLELGWEMALGRGVLWQGQVTAPLVSTENYGAGKVYGRDRVQTRLESSLLSYQHLVAPNLWARASIGYVMHNDYGGQVDLAWLSPQGSLRLGALAGYYVGPDNTGLTQERVTHPFGLASARWSVIDGRWMLEAQAGQFYNQDSGFRLASHHWYGDNRLTLHYRNTEYTSATSQRRLQFAGFEISMPIGNRAASQVGLATVRGSDQWVYGLETKVGGVDNYINTGFGVLPAVRHGLLNDTLDYDRAGLSDIHANLYRVRAMLREMMGKP